MQRLRSTWLALVGGALLVALSVSAAFGAPPTGEDAPRGQTVAAFVHELVFGSDEETDEEEVVDEDESESDTDEEGSDEQLTEEGSEEELDEGQLEEEVEGETEEFANHGECVSDEASDKTDETEEDGNHGAVVSFAAQVTCADLLEDTEETDEVVEEEEREVPEEFANHGECVSTAAREGAPEESNYLTHGKWVSENARYTCWGLEPPTEGDAEEEAELEETSDSTVEEEEGDTEELSAKEQRKADQAAARDARKAERETAKPAKASNRGNGGGNGGGNGRGGGRP